MSQESRITDDAVANNDVAPQPSLLAKIGRWTRTELVTPIPSWAGLVFGMIALVMGVIAGLAIDGNNDAQPQAAAPTTTVINNTTVAAAPAPVASTPKPSYTQTAGRTYRDGVSYGLAYSCGADQTPVQLTPGQTFQFDGTTFSLEEDAGLTSWGKKTQRSLNLVFELSSTTALPGLIIQPVANVVSPQAYNQTAFDMNMPAGSRGSRLFVPTAFVDNYLDEGIARITLCLKK